MSYSSKREINIDDYIEMIDNSHDGIMTSDAEGNIIYLNNAYIRIAGFPQGTVGRNLKDLIKEGYMSRSAPLMAVEKKEVVTLTHHYGGHAFALVVAKPIFDKNGNVVKVITNARDTSEIMKLKSELLKAEEMVQQYSNSFGNIEHDYGKNIIAVSDEMKDVFALAKKTCSVDVSVLIRGESGVGKDVVARYIHEQGSRKNGPFTAINCGAIPEMLLESELFGYVGGAFTGACKGGKKGLFEASDGGTMFLDEIGDISPSFQVKILRVLESRTITRVGDYRQIPVNVRILAATNKNLEEMVKSGDFREDLYYRLNVIKIEIPPLRERCDDIVPMCLFFLDYFNKFYNLKKKMTPEFLDKMKNCSWPGNIRELKNFIDRAVVLSNSDYLTAEDLPAIATRKLKKEDTLYILDEIIPLPEAVENLERELLTMAKLKYITTREMSKVLKIDHSTITRKLKKYGIK